MTNLTLHSVYYGNLRALLSRVDAHNQTRLKDYHLEHPNCAEDTRPH